MTGFTLGGPSGATLGTEHGATLGVASENYLIDGQELPTTTREIATNQTLTLGFRVTTQTLKDVLRPLKTDEDQTSILAKDDGGFSSVDRADGANSFTLTPPPRRQPLRTKGTYRVQRFEEDLVSQGVDEWQVEIEFVRDSNREDIKGLHEEVTGAAFAWTFDQAFTNRGWGFTTRYGTIATDRVDADFLGTGRGGVERYELSTRLRFEEAYSWETALSLLGGARVRGVVDGSNEAVDDTTGSANTITVDAPLGQSIVSDGDYILLGWESRRLNDAYQEVSVELAVKG